MLGKLSSDDYLKASELVKKIRPEYVNQVIRVPIRNNYEFFYTVNFVAVRMRSIINGRMYEWMEWRRLC